MAPAEPTNLQWVFVLIVMRVDCFNAADLADTFFQLPGFQGSLDRQMRVVFCRICPTPIRLSCLALDHDVGPVMLFRAHIVEGNARGGLQDSKNSQSTISIYASCRAA